MWIMHAGGFGMKQDILLEGLRSVHNGRRLCQVVVLLPCRGTGLSLETCGRVGANSLIHTRTSFRHFEGCVGRLRETVVRNRGGGDEVVF